MSTFSGKYPPTGGGGGSGTVTEIDTGAGLNGGPITTAGTIALDIPVTVAHGGTNSVAALNNNRVMQSSGGAIVEAAAITASRALASDSNGIPVASVTTAAELAFVNGVTSAIQTQLNGKQATLTIGNLTDAGTDGIVVTGGTGSIIGSGVSLAQHVADSTHNGYLSSTDWSTFNSKQAALTPGSISTSTTGVTVGSGSASTVGPNVTVNVQTASTSQPGLLSATDWNTFNGKQAAGNYITALTGDVTAAGPGSVASTVAKIAGTTVSGTTGSSNVVFSTSPVLVTPALGTPTSGVLTSCTGLPLTTGVTGVLPLANGGTNKNATAVNGGLVWSDASSLNITAAGTAQNWVLSGGAATPAMSNTTTTGKFFDGSADEIQCRVQGHSTQTSTILSVEKSDTTSLLAVTNTDGTQIRGTTTNSAAASGFVGEYISISILRSATTTSLTTNVSKNVVTAGNAFITLTAGDWDVFGAVSFEFSATTSYTRLSAGTSNTSGAIVGSDTVAVADSTGQYTTSLSSAATVPGSSQIVLAIQPYRVSVANGATVTLYLVALATFTVSALTPNGYLAARRIR